MNSDGTFSNRRELEEYLLKPGNKVITGATKLFYKPNGDLNWPVWTSYEPSKYRPYIEPKPKERSPEGIRALFYAIERNNLVYAQKVLSMLARPVLIDWREVQISGARLYAYEDLMASLEVLSHADDAPVTITVLPSGSRRSD